LKNSNFREAYLLGANLKNADLRGANLQEANTNAAYLSGAIIDDGEGNEYELV